MALSAATVWEVRPSVGSDSNGGGFVTGSSGTDFSQQNSAQYNGTDLIIGSTTTNVSTSSSHSFGSTDVGNILNITAGSGFTTGFYQIVSCSGGIATLDRSAGSASSTGGTYAVGGALATIGQANTILTTANQNVGGQIVWVKATASISTAAQITFQPTNGASLIGYTTTRGDNGQVTVLLTSNSPSQVFELSGVAMYNFICNGQTNGSGIKGFNVVFGGSILVNCKALNLSTGGFVCPNQSNFFIRCVATLCGGGGNSVFNMGSNGVNYCIDCVAYANAGTGFSGSAGAVFTRCISANNTGGASDGFNFGSSQFSLDHCLAYGNGRDGVRMTTINTYQITNSIFYGNAGWGMNNTSGNSVAFMFSDANAYGGNTSGNLNNVTAGAHDVTLTADPTTAGVSDNFALNSTSGGGAACKAVGYPGVLTVGGTGNADIGPLQSSGGGGGGGTVYVINRNQTIFVGEDN